MTTPCCIVCDSVLNDANGSREHIIGNAIGGRRKVHGALCQACNSTCGHTWDKALAKQLNPLAIYFDIVRDRGKPPAEIFETLHDGPVQVGPNGLALSKPTITSSERDGRLVFNVHARSLAEAREIMHGLKKRHPTLDIDPQLPGAVPQYVPLKSPIQFSVQIEGPDAGRAIVKSALTLAASAGVAANQCTLARTYLRTGSNPNFGYFYGRDIVTNRPEETVCCCVAVQSTTGGLLLGYVELFTLYRILICLSEDYSGPFVDTSYAVDPTTGIELDLEFDFTLTDEQLADALEYRASVSDEMTQIAKTVMPIGLERSRLRECQAAVDRAFDNAWKHCGARAEEPLTEENIAVLSRLFAEGIVPFMKSMPNSGLYLNAISERLSKQ